jgi:hypothetical protein
MSNRYFHRTFLAEPSDDSSSGSIVARVAESGDDYLSASLHFSDGFDTITYSLHGFSEEEVTEAVRRAETLAAIVGDFAKALKEEAKTVSKALKQREK